MADQTTLRQRVTVYLDAEAVPSVCIPCGNEEPSGTTECSACGCHEMGHSLMATVNMPNAVQWARDIETIDGVPWDWVWQDTVFAVLPKREGLIEDLMYDGYNVEVI